jgi:regulatory protein
MKASSVMSHSSLSDILSVAYRYLSYRPRTEKEIETYLVEKAEKYNWLQSDMKEAIQVLKEDNHINDRAFIDWYVQSRSTRKYKSTFVIKRELQRYGLSDNLVTAYFEEHPLNEEEQAYQLLARKWNVYEREEKGKRYKKVWTYLSSKGYTSNIIRAAIARIEEGR